MSKIIETIDYFAAGSCSSHLQRMFKGVPKKKISFPAGVFLLKHRSKGYILYDTGYSPAIQKPSLKYWCYGLATPVTMKSGDRIDLLLQENGLVPDDISYIILSHLHPDHLGGAAFFPKARFILTQAVFDRYQKRRLKDLIFREFLPADFDSRLEVVEPQQVEAAFLYRKTVDLFGDGSIYLASVDGHAAGQGCLFLPEYNLFIAADLCWGVDLLPYTEQMRLLPSLVQDSKQDYLAGVALLRRLLADNHQVLVSHDPTERVKEVLHASRNFSENFY
ncbi:MBL fold metallo-hydrolase [Streptococcus panodentis]|uniref:MBL fold metallo-hydrolase n=1 Tax=Streptococcus panodentis TaxID=1581472 RepID=A0ABS5AUM6_9STRE|nr:MULTISPECIES: MBL fold metallo-hydrolase [Streptococcus]KXT84970.1 Metal-dependent hydrolase [Streptococcus sp. DD11]MBP2620273.1 MBL fold metallo-hydrolase [Streptococcus panodentis]